MINYRYQIDLHDGKGLRELKTKPIQGHSDYVKLNEELDNGFMLLILKNKEPLPIMSYLEYYIYDDSGGSITKQFYIGKDEVNISSKYKKYYEHNLELIELTKKFEKNVVGTIAFTQPTEKGKTHYYLNDCIDRLLLICKTEKDYNDGRSYYLDDKKMYNNKRNVAERINNELYNYLKNIPSPQLVFTDSTFREILDGILKYVNGVSRLEKKERFSKITEKIVELQNKTKITFIISERTEVRLCINNLVQDKNFFISWGDYQIEKFNNSVGINYFTHIFDRGTYTISLPEGDKYKLQGNDFNYTCCLTNYKTDENIEIIDFISSGQTEIGDYAFCNCLKLTKVKLSNNLQVIGNYAFYNTKLTEIDIPYSIQKIGNYAFNSKDLHCHISMQCLIPPLIYENTFGDYIHNIYIHIYKGTLNNYKKSYDEWVNIYNQIIEENDENELVYNKINFNINKSGYSDSYVYINLFVTGTELISIDWDDGNGNLPYAFTEAGIQNIKSPNTYDKGNYTIKIGTYTSYFEGFLRYSEITGEEMVSSIYCYGTDESSSTQEKLLDILEIELYTQKIGDYAFANQPYMQKIFISNYIKEIGDYAFANSLFAKIPDKEYGNILYPEKEITISSALENIGKYAFYNDYNYQTKFDIQSPLDNVLELPYNNLTINDYAFYNSGFKEIILNNKIKLIKNESFGVIKNKEIFVSKDIEYIDYQSFSQNVSAYINSDTYPSWNGSAFKDPNNVFFISFYKTNVDEVNIDYFGKLKDIIDLKKNYDENKSMNIEDYATNIFSFSKNVLDEEKYDYIKYISYPYNYDSNEIEWNNNNIKYFGAVKSDIKDYSVTTENYGIQTQYPIQSVINVKIPIYINVLDNDGVINEELNIPYYTLLDVTKYILEEEAYYSLSEYDRRAYFSYKKGTNFIHFGKTYDGIIFTYPALKYILLEALTDFFRPYFSAFPFGVYTGELSLANYSGNTYDRYIFNVRYIYDLLTVNFELFEIYRPQEIGYLIKYIPITNSLYSYEKNKTDEININTTNIVNQENRVLSHINFSNTLYSIAQRTGNKTFEVLLLHKNVDEIFKVGDYTEDKYVITSAEYIYYNNYIIGKYSMDKDYNRISSFMGINADIRQFEIPTAGSTYERNVLVQNYIEISDYYDITNISEEVQEDFILYFVKNLCCGNCDKYIDKINSVVVTFNPEYKDNSPIISHYGDRQPYILLECALRGAKNSFIINFGFYNNYIAGAYTYTESDNVIDEFVGKILKKKIPYTIPDGEYAGFLRNICFKLITNFKANMGAKYSHLPLFYYEEYENLLYNSGDLLILKDPSEILKFTYQLNFINKTDRLVLGNAFFENNYCITGSYNYDNKNGENQRKKCRIYKSYIKYSSTDTTQIIEKNKNIIAEFYQEGKSDEEIYVNWNYTNLEISKGNFYIQLNKNKISKFLDDDVKTIIFADEYDNIIFHMAYDSNNPDKIFEKIYFNFKTKRSDIKYEY